MHTFENYRIHSSPRMSMTLPTLGTQLAVHLLRYYSAVRFREPAGKAGLSREQARRMAEYIDYRLHELLSLPSLAAAVELGVRGFGRRFRESFGRPPAPRLRDRAPRRARPASADGRRPSAQGSGLCLQVRGSGAHNACFAAVWTPRRRPYGAVVGADFWRLAACAVDGTVACT